MNQVKFDRSVSVFIGLGFPREIANVVEAYDILIEWKGIRDLDQNGAIEVCRKALNGERTGRDARLAPSCRNAQARMVHPPLAAVARYPCRKKPT